MNIVSVATKPFSDQKTGTSGLRKKVSVVKQEHYVENFVQSIFDSVSGFEGKTLIVGGDGRFYNDVAIQKIIKLALANQFGRVIVGQNGIFSTPAVSHLITKYKAFGAIILTASHNPAGPDGDFGIKFDMENGAPAPDRVIDKVCERTKTIDRFWTVEMPDIDLSQLGEKQVGSSVVQIIDSVKDYAEYMQEIFDFSVLKKMFDEGFKIRFDGLSAVSGPYAKHIFCDLLGASPDSVQNGIPLPDFGCFHPEPNLINAKHLADLAFSEEAPDMCCASDGDADRYLILGKHFYVSPSDCLALMMQYIDLIPYYKDKIYGVARSMPTAPSVDLVAKDKGYACFETPTGWKFFGSLLDAKKITLCGEESFGAGSLHIREKDGIWAILFMLSILAYTGKTLEQLTREMWQKYGRYYWSLHNYDGLDKEKGDQLMADVLEKLPALQGQAFGPYQIKTAGLYVYTDPVTGDVSKVPCALIEFTNKSRIIMRLSGTTSSTATLRTFYMTYENNPDKFDQDPQEALKNLIDIGHQIADVPSYGGRKEPSGIL